MKNLEKIVNAVGEIKETIKKNQDHWEQQWKETQWSIPQVHSTAKMFSSINDSDAESCAEGKELPIHGNMTTSHAQYQALGKKLQDLRTASLNRYSAIMTIGKSQVRVFLPQEVTTSNTTTRSSRKIKNRTGNNSKHTPASSGLDLSVPQQSRSTRSVTSTANVVGDVSDLFARGLDSARAVTEIFIHAEEKNAYGKLVMLLETFKLTMQKHQQIYQRNKTEGIKEAVGELALFNGALANLVKESLHIEDKQHAVTAINFVRDVIWKRDMSMASCTVESIEGKESNKPSAIIRYTEPMTFGQVIAEDSMLSAPECYESLPDQNRHLPHSPLPIHAINLWNDLKQQPWYTKLLKSVGLKSATKAVDSKEARTHWMDRFIEANSHHLQSKSSTSMSRFTPNLANAFICCDVLIKDGQLAHMSQNTRTAITAPIQVGNTSSVQPITDFNHAQMIKPEPLKVGADALYNNWEGFLDTTKAQRPMPILFQTLIGDEVTLSPDQKKFKASRWSGSFIDYKANANKKLRQALSDCTILRARDSGKIIFMKNEDFRKENLQENLLARGYDKIEIDILETNACINMWDFRARMRNNDFDHPRQLIKYFVELLNEGNNKLASESLTEIIKFLDSSDYSFFLDHKTPSARVNAALAALETALKEEGNTGLAALPLHVKNNLLLTAKAAVELKCLTHETHLGALRRRIANFTRDNFRKLPVLGHLLDWSVRGSMMVLAAALKLGAGLLTPHISIPRSIKHFFDRKSVYKALYEGVLADSLGMRVGGCMSSADRGPEMAEQQAMLKKALISDGMFLSYQSSMKEKMQYFKKYATSCAKHFFLLMATGTVGSSDSETRGYFNSRGIVSATQSKVEQKLAKMFSSARKGKYKATTVDAYLARSEEKVVSPTQSLRDSANGDSSFEQGSGGDTQSHKKSRNSGPYKSGASSDGDRVNAPTRFFSQAQHKGQGPSNHEINHATGHHLEEEEYFKVTVHYQASST